MGPLVEAVLVFVGIPAVVLAAIASVLWGSIVAARRITEAELASEPAAQPARVMAFPGGRTVVLRSAEESDLRKVA